MQKYRFHFIFAVCLGAGVPVFFWLLFRLLQQHPSSVITLILQGTFAYINIIPLELSARLQNYVHAKFAVCLFIVGIFFQWFAVGFGLSFLFCRRKDRDEL
jgi:uncharacterized membrane protein